jgi:hypothetical protein
MMPKGLLSVLVSGIVAATASGEVPSIKPSHERPYFMPESKRKEILKLIRTEPWARRFGRRCGSYPNTTAHQEETDEAPENLGLLRPGGSHGASGAGR